MEWLTENWTEVIEVIAYIVMAASVVTKLTATEKDDYYIGKIKRIVRMIAVDSSVPWTKKGK